MLHLNPGSAGPRRFNLLVTPSTLDLTAGAGTPAEQIIAQCRGCGAGHSLAILARMVDKQRIQAAGLFGEQVIPILRRAEIV